MNISTTDSTYSQQFTSRHAARHDAACLLLEIAHSLRRAGRFFAAMNNQTHDEWDLVALSRVRGRVDGVAKLLSEAAKAAKLLGFDKYAPLVNINGKLIGFQDASRQIRAIQIELKEKEVGDGLGGTLLAPLEFGDYPIDLTKDNSFDDESDDEARKLVAESSRESLREMPDHKLVGMIWDMLSGPTLDEDEKAILKILESVGCDRLGSLLRGPTAQTGFLDRLLSDLDGSEWDRLVVLLVECGIISFDKLDDDASRRFVNTHSCAQLGLLNMNAVRQLVLNMFSGSCGDDDEDTILKLLGCQSTPRLQQLVGMPGTDVGEFDYNFDGDQWDDLEGLFAANGITLDA